MSTESCRKLLAHRLVLLDSNRSVTMPSRLMVYIDLDRDRSIAIGNQLQRFSIVAGHEVGVRWLIRFDLRLQPRPATPHRLARFPQVIHAAKPQANISLWISVNVLGAFRIGSHSGQHQQTVPRAVVRDLIVLQLRRAGPL